MFIAGCEVADTMVTTTDAVAVGDVVIVTAGVIPELVQPVTRITNMHTKEIKINPNRFCTGSTCFIQH